MSTPANALDITQAGLVKFDGSTTFTGVTVTNHDVLVGAASNGITSVSPSTTGKFLMSNGVSADPSFETISNSVLPGSGTITISNGTNISVTGSPVALGGTATVNVAGPPSATTLTNHGVVIGQATSAILATVAGTTGQLLQSKGAAADPNWTTATYPDTASTSGYVITSNGTNFVTAAPAASMKITTYNTADSPATWTKDARTQYIKLYLWGGGGGGGSGRQGASTTSSGGGGGASGGSIYWEGPASAFNTTETVVIGAGGAGGAAQASINTNGNPGAVQTITSFGNLETLIGTAAAGGTTIAVSGGGASKNDGVWSSQQTLFNGGTGNVTSGGAASSTDMTITGSSYSPTPGGGGAGADSASARTGGVGGLIRKLDNSTTLVAGGAGGVETGTINGSNGNVPLTTGGVLTAGTGAGGGGGQKSGGAAGNGGNGAVPGGGGGGGGGSLNGTSSGAGGNGGNGRVLIIELF